MQSGDHGARDVAACRNKPLTVSCAKFKTIPRIIRLKTYPRYNRALPGPAVSPRMHAHAQRRSPGQVCNRLELVVQVELGAHQDTAGAGGSGQVMCDKGWGCAPAG